MFRYPNGMDMSGWGWALMAVGTVAIGLLFLVGTVALVRYLARHDRPVAPLPAPERVLADRFARGEIDEPEYRQRLDTVSSRPGPPMVTSSNS